MDLQAHLESLVAKVAKDFDNAALQERTIECVEDGTVHNYHLDQVLANQKIERDLLWHELEQLEKEEYDGSSVFTEETTAERKRLEIYLYEELQLTKQLRKLEGDVKRVNLDIGVLSDLRFRQKLQQSIKQLTQVVMFLKEQLTEAKTLHQQETRGLAECEQVQETLTDKVVHFDDTLVSMSMRQKVLKARSDYQKTMESLVDFLDQYYPPHFVDSVQVQENHNGEMDPEDYCELKFILEDLMNKAVLDPSNPYVNLEKGTYWSPYVETLIKGNIAERDPHNPSRLKLVDFRIY